MRFAIPALMGCGSIVTAVGIGMICIPAALIFAGLLLIGVAIGLVAHK